MRGHPAAAALEAVDHPQPRGVYCRANSRYRGAHTIKLKDDDIRRLALGFIRSSFIDSGEIKSNSLNESRNPETSSPYPVSLHDVLDDLERKTTNILRQERGWRITKLLLKEGSIIPRELAHTQPYFIQPKKQGLEVYYLTNEPQRPSK